VGTIGFRKLDRAACEIKRLYVRSAYRGLRYGQRLLQAAIDHARQLGYEEAFADTLPSMAPALKLYEAFGFEQTGPYSTRPTPDAIYLRYRIGR
jgi:ribosomal protein S18 acetylase RimI-like enzyme